MTWSVARGCSGLLALLSAPATFRGWTGFPQSPQWHPAPGRTGTMVCCHGLLAERLSPPMSHSWGALPRRCTASLHPGNRAQGTRHGQLALRWARMGSGPLQRVPGFPQGHRASRLARRRCRTTNCCRRATPRGFVAFSVHRTTARLGPPTPFVDVVPSAPFVFPQRSRQNFTLDWQRKCEIRRVLHNL